MANSRLIKGWILVLLDDEQFQNLLFQARMGRYNLCRGHEALELFGVTERPGGPTEILRATKDFLCQPSGP